MMFNPDTAPGGGSYFLPAFEAAGRALGIKAAAAPVRSETEIENAIGSLARERNGGLVVMTDSYMTVHRRDIIRLTERERLPAVYPTSISAHDGGLISYAPDYYDVFRRGAGYVDKVLRGGSASELPVQVPTKFELVINLKTAKALGITISDNLLSLADEVKLCFLLQCRSPLLAVRPEGANYQWRRNPPGELSIDPVADERLMRVTAWVGASRQRSPVGG